VSASEFPTDYHLIDILPQLNYNGEKAMLMKRNPHPALAPCEAKDLGGF